MRIMSRGVRGFAAALVGAGALAAGCGEVQAPPEGTEPQVQQENAPLDCSAATGSEGVKSFGQLMAEVRGPAVPEDFVRDWFAQWAESGAAGGQDIAQVLENWPKRDDGKLDLAKSPLHLWGTRGGAGEKRFVFGVLDASGNPLPFSVTLAPGKDASQGGPVLTAGTAESCLLADDVTAPTVALTSPASGGFARGTVTLTANASDDTGVARVDFFDGASLIGSATQAPFSVAWNTVPASSGTHSLTAKAFDAAGNSATSSAVSVFVDNFAPVLIQGSPQQTQFSQNYVRGTVNVSWSVTDQSLSGVSSVQFLRNGILMAWIPGNSGLTYSYSWNTVGLSGSQTIGIRATDKAGNVANSSRVLIVDNEVPSSELTSPVNGAVVSGVVTLIANAGDSQALGYVAFEVDGVRLSPFATAYPYTQTWDSTGKSGTHVIVAVASDRAGNIKRSNPVTVTVP